MIPAGTRKDQIARFRRAASIVLDEKLPIRDAAERFNMPRASLWRAVDKLRRERAKEQDERDSEQRRHHVAAAVARHADLGGGR